MGEFPLGGRNTTRIFIAILVAKQPYVNIAFPHLIQINRKMGKGTLCPASVGIQQTWQMKRGNKSPAYTTKWKELAEVS